MDGLRTMGTGLPRPTKMTEPGLVKSFHFVVHPTRRKASCLQVRGSTGVGALWTIFIFYFILFMVFETGFFCVALTDLELAL